MKFLVSPQYGPGGISFPRLSQKDFCKFRVSKSALSNELSMREGVVHLKATHPSRSNLLVEAQGTQLTITPTYLLLRIRISCQANVKKQGAGTIPAKELLELVRLQPQGE